MIEICGLTDNSGNEAVLTRLMTSKFPLVIILTELAEQLKAKGWDLSLKWIPRGQNEPADALTNEDFSLFDPEKRVHLEIAKLKFLVMPEMAAVADQLYQEVKERREKTKPQTLVQKLVKKKPGDSLKVRDPW